MGILFWLKKSDEEYFATFDLFELDGPLSDARISHDPAGAALEQEQEQEHTAVPGLTAWIDSAGPFPIGICKI